jgi:uncharacterized membrane protein YfcA
VISSADSAVLLAAGVAAGLVGSAGGITSLISYPVLLAVGLPAHTANIANNVALVACWPGSALGSRPELRGKGPWLARWTPIAAIGAAAGAALLLLTPSHVFARVVPFLVVVGSLTLLFEPRLRARRQRRAPGNHTLALTAGLIPLSLYNGYFGAGSGVMTLSLLLILVDGEMTTANALKNMIIGAAVMVSAAIYVVFGPVHWSAVVPLGLGMLVGSRIGPSVARRLPRGVLRWLVVFLGMALAIDLFINPGA